MVLDTSMTACQWRGQRSICLGSLEQLLSIMMECTFSAVTERRYSNMCSMINFCQKILYYGDLRCVDEYFVIFMYCNVAGLDEIFVTRKFPHTCTCTQYYDKTIFNGHPWLYCHIHAYEKISEIWPPSNGQSVIAFECRSTLNFWGNPFIVCMFMNWRPLPIMSVGMSSWNNIIMSCVPTCICRCGQ